MLQRFAAGQDMFVAGDSADSMSLGCCKSFAFLCAFFQSRIKNSQKLTVPQNLFIFSHTARRQQTFLQKHESCFKLTRRIVIVDGEAEARCKEGKVVP